MMTHDKRPRQPQPGAGIRVEILSASDLSGGAARAAFRLLNALDHTDGINLSMLVQHRISDHPAVRQLKRSVPNRVYRTLAGPIVERLSRTQRNPPNTRSLALLSSGLPTSVDSRAQVTHLHWINAEMCSIAEIGRLRGPLIWTLHDTWVFSGTEHYPYSIEDRRFTSGYPRDSRPAGHTGWDLDRWTWRRKRKHWHRPIFLVCPSRWMQDCVRSSPFTAEWPSAVIPNPLDTDVFAPLDRGFCRQALGLPQDLPLILFGAFRGGKDPRKGFDLLLEALHRLRAQGRHDTVEFVVFGQSAPLSPPPVPARIHWTGPLHDDATLRLLYNAANLFVLPSRQENLPQTATEAQACGCPVVAFDVCGVPDVVQNEVTGYLAEPYDTAQLARGIGRLLEDPITAARFGRAARDRAVALWSHQVTTPRFLELYQGLTRPA